MNCPITSCKNLHCFTKWIIFITLVLIAGIIGIFHLNKPLFYTINSWYPLLPSTIWNGFNFIAAPKHFILPGILIVLSLFFARNKLARIICLIALYFIVFYILKKLFGEARPFITLNTGTFHWLNNTESYLGREYMSFPSGHAGLAAIFVFTINQIFFTNNKFAQYILLIFLILVSITRIVTGWHWPLDVLASGLIGYLLVQLCFFNCKKSCNNE